MIALAQFAYKSPQLSNSHQTEPVPQQLEARNVKRIEALIALAQRRGTTLRGIMAELGLSSEANAK